MFFLKCCLQCWCSYTKWKQGFKKWSTWLFCRLNLMKIKNASTATCFGFVTLIPLELNQSAWYWIHLWHLIRFCLVHDFWRHVVWVTCRIGTWKLMYVFVYSGRNKSSSAVSGTQVLAERSSREGSAQRMPRQPSASRLQKTGASGKNTGGGNST